MFYETEAGNIVMKSVDVMKFGKSKNPEIVSTLSTLDIHLLRETDVHIRDLVVLKIFLVK